tara:strand:+ start:162 stop:974 length:813 start_codon:yes stop_codon:yes gene_type:complete
MRFFFNIIIYSCFIFLISCGTQVPTKTKIKTKTIKGETKKIYLEEKSEKDREELIFRKSIKENNISYEFKSREVFLIPEVLMREDIAKTYITKKKSATMIHNPLGEITGSIFALGMIEAWCLTELATKALPGKQKNIFLDKCKDRYIGSKTKTTEEKVIKEILEFTGYYKEAYQDSLHQIYYRFLQFPDQRFDMIYLNNLACKNKNLEEFDCGRSYHIKSESLIRNYLKINENRKVFYPLEINVFANNNKKILSFSKAQIENIVSDILSE